jgi:hypothetical protein
MANSIMAPSIMNNDTQQYDNAYMTLSANETQHYDT